MAKYVYYEKGHDPSPEDIRRSEILEGRLREGFVRIREVMVSPILPREGTPPVLATGTDG